MEISLFPRFPDHQQLDRQMLPGLDQWLRQRLWVYLQHTEPQTQVVVVVVVEIKLPHSVKWYNKYK